VPLLLNFRPEPQQFTLHKMASCVFQSECPINSYCDSGGSCYQCSYISPGRCDAAGGGSLPCCTASFLDQCPTNPYQCRINTAGTSWLDSIDIPDSLTIPIGIVGLVLGLVINVAGYRLWKYTIFLLGFIILGAVCAVIAATYFGGSCALSQTRSLVSSAKPNLWTSECWKMYGAMAGSGILGGIAGGFCFLGVYFVVVFCLGCACGMSGFWIIVFAILAMMASNDASGLASAVANWGPNAVYYLAVADVISGIVMGIVFIKFQKVCIMLGTAYIGAQMVLLAIFQSFADTELAQGAAAIAQQLLTFGGTAFGFLIQYYFTGKGREIDERTGQVVVVIAPTGPIAYMDTPTNTMQAPLMQDGNNNGGVYGHNRTGPQQFVGGGNAAGFQYPQQYAPGFDGPIVGQSNNQQQIVGARTQPLPQALRLPSDQGAAQEYAPTATWSIDAKASNPQLKETADLQTVLPMQVADQGTLLTLHSSDSSDSSDSDECNASECPPTVAIGAHAKPMVAQEGAGVQTLPSAQVAQRTCYVPDEPTQFDTTVPPESIPQIGANETPYTLRFTSWEDLHVTQAASSSLVPPTTLSLVEFLDSSTVDAGARSRLEDVLGAVDGNGVDALSALNDDQLRDSGLAVAQIKQLRRILSKHRLVVARPVLAPSTS
jgi:hypothetical protein